MRATACGGSSIPTARDWRSADGKSLVYYDGALASTHIWNIASGSETLVVPVGAVSAALSPDGQWLAWTTRQALQVVRVEQPDKVIEIAADTVDPPKAEEVAIAPDGTYAFVRQFGADSLVIVDLLTGDVDRVPVGANPTDLDLTPDGTQAVVVSRAACASTTRCTSSS